MFGCCNSSCSSCSRGNAASSCSGGGPIFPIPPVVPPAPPQLRGMQLSLVGCSSDTIANGANVLFDAVNSNNTLGVGYTPGSGVINLSRTGTYLVNWWVAVQGAEAEELAFAVSLNGSDVQTTYADIGVGEISGTAIVTVGSVPATLSLVNRSGAEATYVTASGQAGMTVTQLA